MEGAIDLFTVFGIQDAMEPAVRFDGSDYDPERDNARLTGQLQRIFDYMKPGDWRTLQEIADATNDPPASVSAQLRHLRKRRFGAHQVDKEHLGDGLYRYRLLVKQGMD